jgi:hypothetical protein
LVVQRQNLASAQTVHHAASTISIQGDDKTSQEGPYDTACPSTFFVRLFILLKTAVIMFDMRIISEPYT